MQVTNPKNGEQIESPYESVRDAVDALSRRVMGGEFTKTEFPLSLISAYNKAAKPNAKYLLSEARTFWIHKLASQGATTPAPKPVAEVDVGRIEHMFAQAAGYLKHPSVILALHDGTEIKMKLAGRRSKYNGSLMVASPKFGDAYYGRVTDGKFYPGRSCNDAVMGLLRRFASSPERVASEAGHLRGACCFCNRALEDEKSTAVGYGPVCAKNYGLRWGGGASRRRMLEIA